MKVSNGIMLACSTFMLTTAAIANSPDQRPVYADDPAPVPAHEVLLPGTMVVAGDPEKHDFYIASEKDAVKIIEAFKLAKLEAEAKVLADKHNETHKDVKFNQKTLAALNVDMKRVLNKYAAYDNKVTIAKVQEKVSTQQFAPTAAVASTVKTTTAPSVVTQPVVATKPEPVMVALEPAELPKLKTKQLGRDHQGASPVLAKAKKVVAKKTLANKAPAKLIKSTKPIKMLAIKKPKHIMVGVVKPFVPEKPIVRRKSIASSKPLTIKRDKFVVKSLTYDKNNKLKLVAKPTKVKLSSNQGGKKRGTHQFQVIHLYR